MSRRSIPSTLSLAILGLVSREPMSGYDLRKIFTTTPMGHFSASPGAIYPALRRMEAAGLIEGNTERGDTLRPRRTYAVTDEGIGLLKDMLSWPVTHNDVVWRLEELMLRFAFMDGLLGRKVSLRFLRELTARIMEYIPYLRRHLEVQREHGRVNGAYALEQGIAKYEATAAWAERVIEELEGRRPRGLS